MKASKVTYIISDIDKAIAFEWIASKINHQKIQLHFILINKGDSELERYFNKEGISFNRVKYSSKYSLFSSFLKVFLLLLRNKPNVVHCHLFEASIIGLLSAYILRIPKRIYTRHHSTYHHEYFPKAVKYDNFCNYLSTHIIAITKRVEEVLLNKEKHTKGKVTIVHHGFDLDKFSNVEAQEIEALKIKYNLKSNEPIIGVISRYVKWKGIQYIIPAFNELLKTYPNAKLVLANTTGPDKQYIQNLLKQLPPESYIEILFENNLFALYKVFDVFVHVPIDRYCEAFGQIYVEALAAGVPSVVTLSGVATEFIEHKKNAWVVNYKNDAEILQGIQVVLTDEFIKKNLIEQGISSVNPFTLEKFIHNLEEIYLTP